jgi:predicted O-methyltransferase YrrM
MPNQDRPRGAGAAAEAPAAASRTWTGSGGYADPLWETVDDYLATRLLPGDDVLDAAVADSAAAGLPPIQVSPLQGKFLHLLAQLSGAREILEIGTLGGYSTIWLARAVPAGGRVVSLELLPANAAVARTNIARAGLTDRAQVLVGPALDTLPTLRDLGYGPFDLVFIDADKGNNPHYLRWAIDLARSGTVIVVDNVVRHGSVADPDNSGDDVRGTQEMFNLAAQIDGFDATVLQTVGVKGYDGFLVGRVR